MILLYTPYKSNKREKDETNIQIVVETLRGELYFHTVERCILKTATTTTAQHQQQQLNITQLNWDMNDDFS